MLYVHAGVTPDIMRSIYSAMGVEDEAFDRLPKWNLDAINREVSEFLSGLTPRSYSAKKSNPVGIALDHALWMQWLNLFEGWTGDKYWKYDELTHLKQDFFCVDVEEVLRKTDCHTMVVGHYYDSSYEGMPQHCGVGGDKTARKQLIFSDYGMYIERIQIMLKITGETVWKIRSGRKTDIIKIN